MALLAIPTTPGVAFQQTRVRLEGKDYGFQLAWNQREARWYVSVLDEASNMLRAGLKLVQAQWPLLTAYHFDERLPPGELFLADSTRTGTPPGFDELGIGLRCELWYREKPQ